MSYENDPCVTVVAHVPDPNFKLEAVVVCDRYHDFLRCTLPQNKFHFDKMVVVTSPKIARRSASASFITWNVC